MITYKEFLGKLDKFINKYYRNRLFKGILLFLSLVIVSFLLSISIEYFFYLSSSLRFSILFTFTFFSVILFIYFILFPIAGIYNIFGRITYMQAAKYLSAHYPELDDKLYNVLELKQLSDNDSSVLLNAAIEQISNKFIAYKFVNVIKYKYLAKYFKYLTLPLLIILLIIFVEPNFITKPTERYLNPYTHFDREFPFEILIENTNMSVSYEDEFELNISVIGAELPEELHIRYNGFNYQCNRVNNNQFTYKFKNVREDISFNLEVGDYISRLYNLEVIPNPQLLNTRLILYYPKHTNKKKEVIEGKLNTSVPEGSKLIWQILTENTLDFDVDFLFPSNRAEKPKHIATTDNGFYEFSKVAYNSFSYNLILKSLAGVGSAQNDTLKYTINVIRDEYPKIKTLEDIKADKLTRIYTLHLSDDYGIKSLILKANIYNEQTAKNSHINDTIRLNFSKNMSLNYTLNISNYSLQPGDELSYFFEVSDNDAINNFKHSVSETFGYRQKSLDDIKIELDSLSKQNDSKMDNTTEDLLKMEEKYEDITKMFIEKNKISWSERQSIDRILEEQQKLLEEYSSFSEDLEKNFSLEKELTDFSEELAEQQNQLEELYKQMLDKDLQKKLEDLQKMMEDAMDKDKIMEAFSDLKEEQESLEEELKRNMELYKQLKFDKALESLLSELNNKKEQLQQLSSKTKDAASKGRDKHKMQDSLRSEQAKFNEDFSKLDNDFSKLEKLNNDLEKPTSFTKPEEEFDAVKQSLNKAESEMSDNMKSANEAQNKAEESLEDLIDNLEEQQENIEDETTAEDAESIRSLLKSVVRTSFKQENLLIGLSNTKVSDPRYSDIIRSQVELKAELDHIVDSIRAISKRQVQIALFTQKEIRSIELYSKEAVQSLLKYHNVIYKRYNFKNTTAKAKQQYIMTSLNNLALLLAESLDNMESAMKSKGSSSKKSKGKPSMSCSNPGSSKKPSKSPKPSLSDMQKALNEQMKAMQKMIEGLKKEGGKTGSDGKLSEELMRATMQQEQIRRSLAEKFNEAKAANRKMAGEYNSILGEMEKTERDLVNRTISQTTLMRQKNIETRLLEAEKAEMKREQEERRVANEGGVFSPVILDVLPDSVLDSKTTKDVFIFSFPVLHPYYDSKVRNYLIKD